MGVDPVTQKEIDKITGRILREAGITAAPVSIEILLDFLRVHREFFDLEDPSLWRTLKHKAKCNAALSIRESATRLNRLRVPRRDSTPAHGHGTLPQP